MLNVELYQTYRTILLGYLRSCEIQQWKQALNSFEDLHQTVSNDQSETACLGAVGCIRVSSMLSWLSYYSGDYKLKDEAINSFYRYSNILDEFNYTEYEPFILARSMMLSFKGYTKEARKIMESIIIKNLGSLEYADVCWILWDKSPIRSALDTKDFLFREHPFLPVIHQYCSSLLKISREREVQGVLEWISEIFPRHPLIIDIKASIEMNLRNWEHASELYNQSSWPKHLYFKLINQSIANPALDLSKEWETFFQSDHARLMDILGSEIEREYNVNAIQYIDYLSQAQFNSFHSLFETGILMFRERCYREAYRCFTYAWKIYPNPPKSFLNYHFTNMTWLADHWPCEPELYELTNHILECYPNDSEDVRNGAFLRELINQEQLEPIFLSNNYYERGVAYSNLGKETLALKEFWLSLENSYCPRAILQQIQYFQRLGCCKVIESLCQMILQESGDNFFNLWELAYCLVNFLFDGKVYVVSHQAILFKTLEQTEKLMIKTALKDFQNLARLARYYRESSRLDQAQKYIEASFDLAESGENFLLIAQEWRLIGGNLLEADSLGEKALSLSLAKSQNRTEQIEIAKEFCNYNLLNNARDILIKLNIIVRYSNLYLNLSPLEWVIVLDCEICLAVEEIEELVKQAFLSLYALVKGKVLHNGGELFINRLRNKMHGLKKLDGIQLWQKLEQQLDQTNAEINQNDSDNIQTSIMQSDIINLATSGEKRKWQHFHDIFFSFFKKENQPLLLNNCVIRTGEQTLHHLLQYWGAILYSLQEEKDRLLNINIPESPDENKPYLLSEEREKLLTLLWKAKLKADETDRGEAAELLMNFYQEEVTLQADWNKKLEQFTKASRRTIKLLTQEGKQILELIKRLASTEKFETLHELNMSECLTADVAILKTWLQTNSFLEKGFQDLSSENDLDQFTYVFNEWEDVFKEMVRHYQADKRKNLTRVYQFRIQGMMEQIYNLHINDDHDDHDHHCFLSTGEIEAPSLTISILDYDWFNICEGNLTIREIILDKKLKIEGDIEIASEIAEIFKP